MGEVMEPAQAGHFPQHGVLRSRSPRQHEQQRQGDRQQNAVQDIERDDAQHGEQGDQELLAAEPPEANQLRNVEQAERRHDQNGAQRRFGQIGQRLREEHQHQGHRPGGHETGHLALAPHGMIHGRSRIGAADRERSAEAGGDLARAQGEELTICVHLVMALGGEAPRHDHRVAVAQQRHAERRRARA